MLHNWAISYEFLLPKHSSLLIKSINRTLKLLVQNFKSRYYKEAVIYSCKVFTTLALTEDPFQWELPPISVYFLEPEE